MQTEATSYVATQRTYDRQVWFAIIMVFFLLPYKRSMRALLLADRPLRVEADEIFISVKTQQRLASPSSTICSSFSFCFAFPAYFLCHSAWCMIKTPPSVSGEWKMTPAWFERLVTGSTSPLTFALQLAWASGLLLSGTMWPQQLNACVRPVSWTELNAYGGGWTVAVSRLSEAPSSIKHFVHIKAVLCQLVKRLIKLLNFLRVIQGFDFKGFLSSDEVLF